jgi:hypothetical protein
MEVPEYVYLLEMSLQNVKHDGDYHPLKVKLDQEGLKLQARRGYFAPKPVKPKNGKYASKSVNRFPDLDARCD